MATNQYHGAQAGLATSILSTGISTWLNYKQNKEAIKAAKRQAKILANTAAKSLALRYNNIMTQAEINRQQAARKVESVRMDQRSAEGEAVAAAAAIGATGKRVELARNMAIQGGAEREITTVEKDLKNAQNQLLLQAEEDEQSINASLRTSTPDIPADTSVAEFATGVQDMLSSYSTYKERKAAIDSQITKI